MLYTVNRSMTSLLPHVFSVTVHRIYNVLFVVVVGSVRRANIQIKWAI